MKYYPLESNLVMLKIINISIDGKLNSMKRLKNTKKCDLKFSYFSWRNILIANRISSSSNVQLNN